MGGGDRSALLWVGIYLVVAMGWTGFWLPGPGRRPSRPVLLGLLWPITIPYVFLRAVWRIIRGPRRKGEPSHGRRSDVARVLLAPPRSTA